MKTEATPPPAAPDATALVIPKYFFVIDVESVGLHGEPFAVGWSVHSRTGGHYEEGFLACPMSEAKGSDQDREWCLKNIPEIPVNRRTPRAVRDAFWPVWMLWKEQCAVMVADCGWPVEAHFLALCIADDSTRNWNGPYPLHDVASVLLAAGKDPLSTHERNIEELPRHHPMKDARQSGRLLVEAITHITELQARCARLEEDGKRLAELTQTLSRIQPIVDEVGKLATLPNCENRCGEWTDVCNAVRAIISKYRGFLAARNAKEAT